MQISADCLMDTPENRIVVGTLALVQSPRLHFDLQNRVDDLLKRLHEVTWIRPRSREHRRTSVDAPEPALPSHTGPLWIDSERFGPHERNGRVQCREFFPSNGSDIRESGCELVAVRPTGQGGDSILQLARYQAPHEVANPECNNPTRSALALI